MLAFFGNLAPMEMVVLAEGGLDLEDQVEDEALGFRVIARRYGHDLIFEIETAFREGEGTSLGSRLRPRMNTGIMMATRISGTR